MAQDLFSIVTLTSTAYPAEAQCDLRLPKEVRGGLSLLNKGTKKVRYSFDGVHDHGELDPADPSVGEVFDDRKRDALWLRLGDGETGSTTVKVIAWVSE